MSIYISEVEATPAFSHGLKIGETEPSKESKYLYHEVYFYKDKIVACVIDDGDLVCGEEITVDELSYYVDDIDAAIKLIEQVK